MVRRHDDLFDRIASFDALTAAAKRAAAGKRRKPGTASFLFGLEREVLRLERELQEGSYRTGRYLEIIVRDPKRRVVSAAPFRDRVVHHALFAVIGPIFERGFIDHSYANRTGYGTHRAVARFERLRDRHRHVLRADIWRYFPAIDHAVLKRDLRRRIACERTLALCDTIIDGSNAQEPAEWFFPGDDLFSVTERRRGLPLGNLTSQFFANVYLDGLRRGWQSGDIDAPEVHRRVQSWTAHAQHADTVRLRHTLFKGGWFDPQWSDGQPVEAPAP